MADLVGLDELLLALDRVQADLERDNRAGDATAEQLGSTARALAPVATNRLRRAIRVVGNEVEFGNARVDYAAPVNKGTSNRPQGGSNPATGFIDRAVAQAEEFAAAAFEVEIDRATSRHGLT